MSGLATSGADAAIERLATKAGHIARAHAERLARADAGWRRPDLLWPLAAPLP
jgi:hypothetical protein